MKTVMIAICAALSLSALADMKIATVNMVDLVKLHPSYESNKALLKSTDKDYKAKLDKRQDEIKAIADEGKKAQEDLSNPMLSASAKASAQKKLEGVQRRYIAARQDMEAEVRRYQSELSDLEARLMKLQTAHDAHRFGIASWWMILAAALLTSAAGVCLLVRPAQSVRIGMQLFGAVLLAEGLLNLLTVLVTVKIVRNQKPDIIDIDCEEEIK